QGPLFPCLLVNKQWNETANRILYRNLYFDTLDKWNCFNSKENNNDLSMIIITKKLVLSKLPLTGAVDAANITRLRGNIEWLEIYMCPSILPPLELFTSSLRNILLPGCALVNDSTLYAIGRNCPDLETLDLRACSRITDQGLKFIARTCLKLKTLNVGQTLNSRSGITHNSIKEIARYTSVTTLGVSGCAITDQTVWEIALYRGKNLERLSLNNCKLLTNESIPRILGYVPNLSVLEMRGCVNITNMRPVLEFKRFQLALGRTPLIEGCVVIKRRLQEMDWALTMEVSRDVLSHCIEWIYKADYDKNN
ncbi:RNI-like protein, partial [Nadsonia fulvescens var. elongata DSM 6958]